MLSFVIVADLRTGSTLLSSSLDRHPRVRCFGELLHPEDLPDNQLADRDRHDLSGRELVRQVFSNDRVDAVGFRAMIFLPLPESPAWADAWDALRDVDGLKVIFLERRDRLAQYASILVAEQTRAWHPSPDDPVLRPENRPRISVDPDEFRRWSLGRDELNAQRRASLRGRPTLDLEYETLSDAWGDAIGRVQEFLEVRPLPLRQEKQLQERRALSEVISNYDEAVAVSRQIPRSAARDA